MDHVAQKERIHVELVRQALKLAPMAIAATLLNAFILILILWNVTSHPLLLGWFSATCLLALARSIFLYNHRPASLRPEQAALASRWLVINLGLSGVMWGCAAIFLFPVSSPTHQVLFVLMLCGMVAGATATFSFVIEAFVAFTIPALVPVVIRFLIIGGDIYYAMSAMTLLYIVLTFIISKRSNITNRELIELKEHFAQVGDALEKSNAQLQAEIADRQRIETTLRNSETQLRLLSSRLLSAQEEERKRIAHELHDSIGASLSVIKMSLRKLLGKVDLDSDLAKSIEIVISVTQQTIDEARNIVTSLRPSMLDDLGLITTIGSFCESFQALHTDIFVEENIEAEEKDIPEDLKMVIYRVVQETFHNIAKHSQAEFVELSLKKVADTLQLVIEDNGEGFDVEEALSRGYSQKGLGLMSMKERAELSGASLSIKSVRGEGTVLIARWPLGTLQRQERS